MSFIFMQSQITRCSSSIITLIAWKWSFSRMTSHMLDQISLLYEFLVTKLASERLKVGMRFLVSIQASACFESFGTYRANIFSFSDMHLLKRRSSSLMKFNESLLKFNESLLKNPDIRTPLVVNFSLGVVIHFSSLTAF